ncbi:tyrosine-type recombinase/integrase [Hansschlegelia sp. KR7-227]|uniref:tyrosine-type recombinase/integrase n=1 Tax=Hansschlegelia sp. KR7-227 TaxID=3400914 RepID=UPI003C0828BA
MTVDVAVGRYWDEVGQHGATPDLWGNLERIVDWIGAETELTDVTSDLMSRLIARRRAEYRRGDPKLGLVTASTVNRSFTMIVRRILTRARTVWDQPIKELPWGKLTLAEPKERVRELGHDEEIRLEKWERPGYTALRLFAQATGLRRGDALITWPQVDWANGVIRIFEAKVDEWREMPVTPDIIEILWPLYTAADRHETHVFTYTAQKTRRCPKSGNVYKRGDRYPITEEGWSTEHSRVCKRAGVVDFKIHDERHTAATRLLRGGGGNLKIVQKVLGHKSITTTMKYAHVDDDDIRAAMTARAADTARRRADHEAKAAAKTPTSAPTVDQSRPDKRLKSNGKK